MSDCRPRMEVCPYCQKPFKRLKSHLPYCKMRGPTRPSNQKVSPSKSATLSHTEEMKGPTKNLTKAKEGRLGTEHEERKSTLTRDMVASFPLLAVGSERARAAKDPDQLPFMLLKHTEPKPAFQGDTPAQLAASDHTSSERERAKDVLRAERSRCGPSETEPSLLGGPVELSLSNQDRKDSSAQPDEAQATSVNLKSDMSDPQRQGLPVKLIDTPVGDCHSPRNLSNGVQRVRVSMWNKERDYRGSSHLPGASADVVDIESWGKDSALPVFSPHGSLLGKIQAKDNQGKEPGLGVEAHGSREKAEESVSATERQEGAAVSSGTSATEKLKDEGPLLNLSPLQEAAHLTVSQSSHRSLVPLAMKPLLEEKAPFCGHRQVPDAKLLVAIKARAVAASSGHQPQALRAGIPQSPHSAQHHFPQSSLIGHSHVGAADGRTLPSSMGLEWFPELYPGYLGLGVLPGKPQNWNSLAQKPQLSSPQGESLSQVPLLGRSSTELRSLEPPARLATSSFPLMRLLGAVHKGWIRCSTTLKKSGVGGVTMLFTGYFILCCSWSFRHLS